MAAPSIYVLNNPMQVAAPLRYVDANGNLVTQLYPTDYLSLVGSTTGTQVNQIVQINSILTTYQATLTSLQNQITAIQTSGATNIPYVNGGCLNGSVSAQVQTITTLLVANTCSYNAVLGTTTALAQAILAEGSATLNPLAAFSQNSAMAGLTGWITAPTTIADTDNNQWLAYLDARSGISRALAAVTPTCAQVIVDAQVTMPAFGTGFNVYFDGYTFIPTGYTDNGSTIVITDSNGNTATNGINIITQSTTNSPYNFMTSGTTLQSGLSYTVYVNSKVVNSSLGTSCQKTIAKTVTTPAGTTNGRFDVGTYSQIVTSGTTSIGPSFTIVTGVAYTPRHVSWSLTNDYSRQTLLSASQWFMTYTQGQATLTFTNGISGPIPGTFQLSWVSFE